jgi:hypothetical protein
MAPDLDLVVHADQHSRRRRVGTDLVAGSIEANSRAGFVQEFFAGDGTTGVAQGHSVPTMLIHDFARATARRPRP